MGFVRKSINGITLETRRGSATAHVGNMEMWLSKDFANADDGPYYHLEMRYADWLRLRAWLNEPAVLDEMEKATGDQPEGKASEEG